MIDLWREWLYPLGFLSSLAFGGRMLVQWLTSEAKRKSVVTPTFWNLSLAGNILLAMHALIQVQFHVCLVQVCNGIISWRNLNLMRPSSKQIGTLQTALLLALGILSTLIAFSLAGLLLPSTETWFRIPVTPWQQHASVNVQFIWHLMGFLGLILFSSRFWIQWWYAERRNSSYLGRAFWWASLIGEGLCLAYFYKIGDPVNYIGPAFGMIPYIRNLMLIYKSQPEHNEG